MCVSACGDTKNEPNAGETEKQTSGSTEPKTESSPCEHKYEMSVKENPRALKEGINLHTCKKCGDSYEETVPATKSVKILAIGNSFSVDAMEYLYDICISGGVEEIILGNLYIGGCSLDTHWNNIKGNRPDYRFYTNYGYGWSSVEGMTIKYALQEEDWDIITIQQASHDSGVPSTYSHMSDIVDFVNNYKTNPDAEIWWHMTWAYQADSTHSGFAKYDKNQLTMYGDIVDTVKSKIVGNSEISGIIPVGTAIQNLRTSHIGDTITRDGYHLSYDYGRYTAALTWYAALTGGDIEAVDYVPRSYTTIIENELDTIREAVSNAMKSNFAVTEAK